MAARWVGPLLMAAIHQHGATRYTLLHQRALPMHPVLTCRLVAPDVPAALLHYTFAAQVGCAGLWLVAGAVLSLCGCVSWPQDVFSKRTLHVSA